MKGEIRLLHVDDDPEFVDLAATFLEREDGSFTVETATSVEDALELLESGFDGIISDYEMPDTNGLAFLERVRETHPDLPFVLFTGQGSEEIASEAVSAGVTDYLQKGGGTDQYTVLANRVRNAVEQYRSKRALAESQKRLSLFIEQSPLGVIEWNEAFEITRLNAAAEEIFGYTEAELRGRSWEAIVSESDREKVKEDVRELLAASGGYHSINENVRKDGERIVCEWHNRVVTDESDEVVAVFSQFRDVTEREERKRTLQRERDRFKTLFENIPVAVVRSVYEDETPIVRQVNPAFEETFGYDSATIVGENLDTFIVPETAPHPGEKLTQELLETGRVRRQVRRRTVDGIGEFVGEFALINPRAETPELYAIYTEITGEVSDRRRLEALFENSPDMIDVHDADGTILDANRKLCATLGHTEDELIGRKVWNVDREIDPEAADRLWEGMEVNEPQRIETLYERHDGSTFPVEVHVVRLNLQGEDRFLAIARDMTEREHRERELERQNERLEEFAGVLSHDLRSPLSVAKGRIELARPESDSDDLDIAIDALDRMERLIEDILSVARDGRPVEDPEPVDVASVVESGWHNVATESARLTVETDRVVLADEGRFQQLLENLVRNSVEHGSTGSRPQADDSVEHGSTGPDSQARQDGVEEGDEGVTITVGDLEDGFYVEDDGSGIPPDERAAVFEAGYSTDESGTGFGLSIVKEIVDAHGWEISVTESDGGGARFEITGVEAPDSQ